MPVGIAGNDVIKSSGGNGEIAGDGFCAGRREKEAENGQSQDGGPSEEAVFGGEKDYTPVGRGPIPRQRGVGTEAEKSSEDDGASDQSGQEGEQHGKREGTICGEERCDGAEFPGAPGIPIGAQGFDQREEKKDAVWKINVDHQAGEEAEEIPLKEGTAIARAIPIPEKQGHGKGGVGVGPGGIEIHINRKRTGAPDGESGKEGPAIVNVLSGEEVGKEQAKESIYGGTQGHGQDVGGGETIRRDMRAKSVSEKHEGVRRKQKRSPKHGRTDGEKVTDVSGFGVLTWNELPVGEGARLRKVRIGVAPIFFEAQIVLYERRASISVISHAVAMHDRIHQRQ